MINTRTKDVTIDGTSYEIRRTTPAVGGFIWQQLMRACYKSAADAVQVAHTEPEQPEQPKAPPEERLRAICGVAFMHLSIDDFTFVQNSCMKLLSRREGAALIPVMSSDERWGAPDLAENPFLVTRLTVEVLVHNLQSFLA